MHTIIALSEPSLITSYSCSCHPSMLSSISTWPIAECRIPWLAISTNSPILKAVPPPKPPSVNAGLIRRGKEPSSSAAAITSSIESQARALQTGRSISSQTFLNRSLSSASSIAARLHPINSTPNSSRVPSLASADAMFSAVCPPIPARRASGFSDSIILLTTSGSNGSMYILSAISGSFWIVAGFELTRITS